MTPNNKTEGFTVVELIIVVSIIAILAAIGLVSWSGSQNRAKQNAAVTTLAKVKLQLGEYYTDNNTYPVNKAAICDQPTHAIIPAGDLYTEFCVNTSASSHYLYTASPTGCDGGSITCTSYLLTAQKDIWNGSTDETLRPH